MHERIWGNEEADSLAREGKDTDFVGTESFYILYGAYVINIVMAPGNRTKSKFIGDNILASGNPKG